MGFTVGTGVIVVVVEAVVVASEEPSVFSLTISVASSCAETNADNKRIMNVSHCTSQKGNTE